MAKQFESFQHKKQKKTGGEESVLQHSVIHDITKSITAHAKDAIVEVLREGSPIKMSAGKKHTTSENSHELFDERELQLAIERSLGMTALSLVKDPYLAGHINLKNQLREELGGVPSTYLAASQESVGQQRHRMSRGSRAKCSRASRNTLVDLCMSDEESSGNNDLAKMRQRIKLKLLKLYKDENDETKKRKIKYTMKAIDESNQSVTNEMIDYTVDVHTTVLESFNSFDAAMDILDFAEDEIKE